MSTGDHDDTTSDDAVQALLAGQSQEDAEAALREAAPDMSDAEIAAHLRRRKGR